MKSFALAGVCLLATAVPASSQIVRVSVSTTGVEGNQLSSGPSISGDGRYVVFYSLADNLVADDTNGSSDIFLRDRDTDADGVFDEPGAVATTRLSLGPGGAQATPGGSYLPIITPDARYVFYLSFATNIAGDPPASGPFPLRLNRLDRSTGTTIRVAADPELTFYAVSATGDVAVYQPAGSTTLNIIQISTGQTSALPAPYVPANPSASLIHFGPSISADGTRVAYWTGELTTPPVTQRRVYVFDRTTGTNTLVTTDAEAPISATIDAAGVNVGLRFEGRALRRVIASGAETPSFPQGAIDPLIGRSHALSPSGRWNLSGGALGDFTLGVQTPLPFSLDLSAFSANDRWLATSSQLSSMVSGDTNNVSDVFVIDLPDFLDADDDTMDDRWETQFGVTDPSSDPDGDGQTNAQEEDAGTHPNGQVRRFLAEGATGTFFQTEIALANPDPALAATAVLTFDSGGGTRVRRPIAIPAGRSVVVDVGAVSGFEAANVSTTVESDRLLGIQRTMFWGGSASVPPYGSHAETATAAPSPTWFLAEGTTVADFNLFYLLQNPQTTVTQATVRFLLPSGTTIERSYTLPPGSRTTIYVNEIPGLEDTDVSGDILAGAPIVVERAMYRNLPNQVFGLGHDSMGVTAPATSWFLAEGATGPFFDLYVLIANPSGSDATVRADYARADGSIVTQTYTVRARSRFSVFVDPIPGLANTPVATTLTSTNAVPIVAERAMYWPGGFFDYYEGHSSAGSTTTALSWVVAGAENGGPNSVQTYVLIANTENRAGEATITLLPDVANPSAPPPPAPFVMALPANSRATVPVAIAGRYGVLVTSTGASPVRLVVESAVYSSGGATWDAGASALATSIP